MRQHIAIVMQPINHFPVHYDFIDRSKKSAEVRMAEVSRNSETRKEVISRRLLTGYALFAVARYMRATEPLTEVPPPRLLGSAQDR